MKIYMLRGVLARADAHQVYADARLVNPVCYDPEMGWWNILGYEQLLWALKNPQILSSKYNSAFDPVLSGNDPPDHTRYRKALLQAMSGFDKQQVTTICKNWMQEFISRVRKGDGCFEASADIACHLPEDLTGAILGLDFAEIEYLKSLRPQNRTQLNESWPSITDFFFKLIHCEDSSNRGGVCGSFLNSPSADRLNDEEIVGLARVLWFASTSTIGHFIPSLIALLLKTPDMVHILRRDSGLTPSFVSESFRLEGPTGAMPRKAAQDFEIAGCKIPAFSMVKLCLLSANSDSLSIENPLQIRLDRPASQSLAFGTGIHFCVGSLIAKTMSAVLVDELLANFQSLEAVDSLNDLHYSESESFRSMKKLEVKVL